MFGAGGLVWMGGRGLKLHNREANSLVRLALWSGICGLVGYLFYGLALPGSTFLEEIKPGLRGLLLGFVCGLLPLPGVLWLVRRSSRNR